MSHTLGPWHVEKGRDNTPIDIKNGEPIYGSIVDMDDFIVARIWSDQPDAAKRAALVAAAPDLLAALESIAANTCCGKCQEAALVARAAIAKTKGKS